MIGTRDIILAAVARLEALELPEEWGGGKCFDAVKPFDLSDLGKAIEELFTFKARVCFVVLSQNQYESDVAGRVFRAKKFTELELLIADRNFGVRSVALMGDPTKTPPVPGALVLADLVIEKLSGNQTDKNYLFLPSSGQLFAVDGKVREELAGRICWRQPFQVHAGDLRLNLTRDVTIV